MEETRPTFGFLAGSEGGKRNLLSLVLTAVGDGRTRFEDNPARETVSLR